MFDFIVHSLVWFWLVLISIFSDGAKAVFGASSHRLFPEGSGDKTGLSLAIQCPVLS